MFGACAAILEIENPQSKVAIKEILGRQKLEALNLDFIIAL
jgi:hypothetical protein